MKQLSHGGVGRLAFSLIFKSALGDCVSLQWLQKEWLAVAAAALVGLVDLIWCMELADGRGCCVPVMIRLDSVHPVRWCGRGCVVGSGGEW